MRYVIMGTAGHIDHGKSQLVKALTGTDPDRLKEEKERGITIDLGFADLVFPGGLTIGIVDVPGHERLVRNMLAGAGGMDFVLLVIAADEGIMPQSREHLNICGLLKIRTGLVALTKTDLVEPDWLELVAEEVAGFVRGTFLDGARVLPVSSKTGEGMEALKAAISEVASSVEPKPVEGLFRLPVDRVFTLKGFGTVTTGTVVSGTVGDGETIEILPSGMKAKLRGLHSHGKAVSNVYAGQRAALNLQGVEKEDLARGDVLVSAGRFAPTRTLDVKIQMLPSAPALKNRSLVHFHLGTSETIARVVLYGAEKLGPEDSSFCQVRLDAPVVAQSGDRFIIRRFSPLETIGGGVVLDPSPSRRRKRDGTADLEVFETGTVQEKIAVKAGKSSLQGMPRASVEGWLKEEVTVIRDAIDKLIKDGVLGQFDDVLMHDDAREKLKAAVLERLEKFHALHPLKNGIPKEELRTVLRVMNRAFARIVEGMPEVVVDRDILRLRSFKASVSDEDRKMIIESLERGAFQPPSPGDMAREISSDAKSVSDILKLMHIEGAAARINDSLYMSRKHYDRMLGMLKEFFSNKHEMTVAEFRDLLGTTRKYALPYLEYLDSNNITLRVGDVRKSLLK